MSASLYLTRAIHMPVSSDGCAIRNSFGVVIATTVDPSTADAMAEVINLGHAGAIGRDQQQEIAERRRQKLLRRGSANLEALQHSPYHPQDKGRAEHAHRRLQGGAEHTDASAVLARTREVQQAELQAAVLKVRGRKA